MQKFVLYLYFTVHAFVCLCSQACMAMCLARGAPLACDGTTWRQEADGVTGKGGEGRRGKRMGEGYKGSRISDRLELFPQREAITGGNGGGTCWLGLPQSLLAIC